MNTLIDKLKNDTFSGIFDLTGASLWPIVIASGIQMIITSILVLPLILSIFNLSIESLEGLQKYQGDPEMLKEQLTIIIEESLRDFGTTNLISILFLFLVMVFVSAWVYNVAFIAIKDAIDGDKVSVKEVFSRSFNNGVVKLFVVLIIFMLIWIIGIVGFPIVMETLGLSGTGIGTILGLAFSILFYAFLFRLSISSPIVSYSETGAVNSIKESLDAISMGKGLKYFIISILVAIVLFIAFLVVLFVTSLFVMIPVAGPILSLVGNVLFSGILTSLVASFMFALYVKYGKADFDQEKNSLEDHLLYHN